MDIKQFITKLIYFLQALFFKKDTQCPFCLSPNFKIIYKKRKIVDICHCQDCGLFWTNPIFKFWRFYEFLYKEKGLATKLLKKEQISALKNSLFKCSDKDYSPIIDWVKKISEGRRLLEFGSSWGYFLYQSKLKGFESIGVEISKRRAEYGKNHLEVNIVNNIDELISKGEKFDVIFSTHTLEHIGYEIKDIFKKFHNLLKEKGVVVIEVPHLNLRKGKKVFKIMGAVHPLGFHGEFFVKNLAKYNFEVKTHIGYKNIMTDYKGNGDNLIVICKKRK